MYKRQVFGIFVHARQDTHEQIGRHVVVTGQARPVGLQIPVSYTHLRAHETVLDLVCRLLLEKKKHSTIHHYLTALNDVHSITDSTNTHNFISELTHTTP